MTDSLDTDDPSRPRVRLAPDVRRQIDATRLTYDDHHNVNSEGIGYINDQIATLVRSQSEMEALAFAAGYELGPPEFETEFGPNVYRITATRTLRPRHE